MPQTIAPAISPELLAKIPTLIALGQQLKTSPNTKDFGEAFRIARIIQEAERLDFPINQPLAKLIAQETELAAEQVQTTFADQIKELQSTKQPSIITALMFGILFYLKPQHCAFTMADSILENNKKLSPEAKSLLKAMLYPAMLYSHPPTALTMFSAEAVKTALSTLRLNYNKQQMMLTMYAINWLLEDNTPSKLIERWYQQSFETLGSSLYFPVGVGTLLFRYRHSLFEAAEQFFNGMHGFYPDDDDEDGQRIASRPVV